MVGMPERATAPPEHLTEEHLEYVSRADAMTVAVARQDPATCAELILRDEETGDPIENQSFHEDWHDAADEHDRLILMTHPESGKTNQMLVNRPLWELGNDPTLRCVVLSKTYRQAEKVTRTQARYISGSEELHLVFPNLRPGAKWTDGMFDVRKPFPTRTPSMQAIGIGSAITGDRIDRLYIDDLIDWENTRNPARREEVERFLLKQIFPRLTKRARIIICTNAWHPSDVVHKLMKRKRWHVVKHNVLDPQGHPTWPQQWSATRIEEEREAYGPLEFARIYMNQARDEGDSEFSEDYVRLCKEQGRGFSMVYVLDEALPPGCFILTGVDLATGRKKRLGKKKSDKTVLTTTLFYPDGKKQLLWVKSGRWKGPQILAEIRGTYERYGSIAIVEDNAAQVYLLQFLAEEDDPPPIYAWTTTGPKKWNPNFGVASLAIEMARGDWIYPCSEPYPGAPIDECVCDEEVQQLIEDQLYFDPSAHTGDHLMSMWFVREGGRRIRRDRTKESGGGVNVTVVGGGEPGSGLESV